MAQQVNKKALTLIQKIKTVLEDDTLDDPECFYRIDAMVEAFYEAGFFVGRHD